MTERTVTLGGKPYAIKMLPMKANAEWRRQLAGPFAQVSQVLEGSFEIALSDLKGIAGLVRSLSGSLIGSMDSLLELLFAYAPELAADRAWIEEHAFDDEALSAFVEVLRLAYPFETLASLRRPGPATTSISSSLPLASGGSRKRS